MRTYVDPFPGDGLKIGHADYEGLVVKVYGRYWAEQYVPQSDEEVCISIGSRASNAIDHAPARLNYKFADILRVWFDDDSQTDFYSHSPQGLRPEQADLIAEFVLNHRNKKVIVVHCYAGINRSRSTAEAICRELQLPLSYTINHYPVFESVSKALKKRLQDENQGIN